MSLFTRSEIEEYAGAGDRALRGALESLRADVAAGGVSARVFYDDPDATARLARRAVDGAAVKAIGRDVERASVCLRNSQAWVADDGLSAIATANARQAARELSFLADLLAVLADEMAAAL